MSQNRHGSTSKYMTHFYAHGWYWGHWLISPTLGEPLDDYLILYAPSASMRKSIGSATSFFHTSMMVNHGSDDHLRIRKFIHDGLLSSISKEQPNGGVSLNNVSLELDYKLPINTLMKQLYIAVQYFYDTNWLTMEEDYQAIYSLTISKRSDYVTKTIDGELIDINQLEMNKMNSTKSIVSTQMRS